MTPDGYGGNARCWQLKRHAQKLAAAKARAPYVVFVGDSITHNWEEKFNDHWKRSFAHYRALNLGFSADRTEHVLWRITEGGELDGYAAKAVVLMIGTNNSGQYDFTDEPPADTILAIREILRVIRAKQPTAKIILHPIFPRGPNARASDARNRVVNREIVKFADGKDIFWCDFNAQLMTVDGRLPHEIFPDQLHPARYGYDVWFAAVKPYLDYALSEGKLPAPPNRYAPFLRPGEVRVDEPSTVFPTSRFTSADDELLDRLLEKRTQISATTGTVDVVLFGDSITHFWEATDPNRGGAEAYAKLCREYSVLNIGYAGDRTETLVWRGRNGELDGYRAKCVVLMIGTNNKQDSPEDVARGIRAVLDVIAFKQPEAKVILHPIFPRGKKDDKLRAKNERTNALIRDYADGERVIWCDLGEKFLDAKGDTKWAMPDHRHPNAEAYADIWLPALLPLLEKLCK